MKRYPWQATIWPLLLVAMASAASAQQRDPHTGYAYPGGGRVGTECEVTVGGQYLAGVSGVYFSGQGVEATIVKHKKLATQGDANRTRDKLDVARKELETTDEEGRTVGKKAKPRDIEKLAIEMGLLDQEELDDAADYRRRRNDPKRQLNPQLSEWVKINVSISAGAPLGKRELRLITGTGLSNPQYFMVGELPEFHEIEPNDITLVDETRYELPVVLNGQIMPGDVDRFRFKANKEDDVVMVTSARELVPYLADAVPGWFQATLTLYNSKDIEVGYSDDYKFHPDPVLNYKVPQNGSFGLEIKDSIYRGREDFVYRIAIGKLPFITSVFPMGCRQGEKVTVALEGWNLPQETLVVDATDLQPGRHSVSIRGETLLSNSLPFVVDTLPESLDKEPNNDRENAQQLRPPLIINGRIDEPGDRDVFRFEGRKGGKIAMEVLARRIHSPVDSFLKLTDADGKQLMINDDTVDKGAGLATHHADSLLYAELPKGGAYYVHLTDTQNKGGSAYGYRLRISARRPRFDLRVVPSAINGRPGQIKPITVYALRRDGFTGEIALKLKNPPPGVTLSGGYIPAGEEKAEVHLTLPGIPSEEPLRLGVDGIATIGDREVVRSAEPADDVMQAFLWRHLLVADELLALAVKPKPRRGRR